MLESDADICRAMAWVLRQQLRGFAHCVMVVVGPPTQWTKVAKNAEEGVSCAAAQVGLVTGLGLAVEAVIAANIWSFAARTLK